MAYTVQRDGIGVRMCVRVLVRVVRVSVCERLRVCICMCVRVIYIYIYAYIHTYVHIHIYICIFIDLLTCAPCAWEDRPDLKRLGGWGSQPSGAQRPCAPSSTRDPRRRSVENEDSLEEIIKHIHRYICMNIHVYIYIDVHIYAYCRRQRETRAGGL